MTTQAQAKFASFNWMRGVFGDKRISIIHRFILTRLVVYRRKDGRCDPGYDPVAKELGVDRTTVMRAVDVGVRFGWLAPPVRGRRANANFVFTFADQEVASGSDFKEDDQEVASGSDFKGDQEVAPDELRSRSKRVKKSLKKEAFRATSKASTEHGHLTGKENGKREEIYPPPVASRGVKKARKRLAAEARIKAQAEPNRDAATAEADDDELRASFSEFKGVYPSKVALDKAWDEYRRVVVDLGVSPDFLNNRARVYAITEQWRIESSKDPQHQRGFTKQARNWLKEGWYNNPLPDGAAMDENGLVTEIKQQEAQEDERDPLEVVMELAPQLWPNWKDGQ